MKKIFWIHYAKGINRGVLCLWFILVLSSVCICFSSNIYRIPLFIVINIFLLGCMFLPSYTICKYNRLITSPQQHCSELSWAKTRSLCKRFGLLGAHRYYAGFKLSALLYTLTLGGLGILWMVDWNMLNQGAFTDNAGGFIITDKQSEMYQEYFRKQKEAMWYSGSKSGSATPPKGWEKTNDKDYFDTQVMPDDSSYSTQPAPDHYTKERVPQTRVADEPCIAHDRQGLDPDTTMFAGKTSPCNPAVNSDESSANEEGPNTKSKPKAEPMPSEPSGGPKEPQTPEGADRDACSKVLVHASTELHTAQDNERFEPCTTTHDEEDDVSDTDRYKEDLYSIDTSESEDEDAEDTERTWPQEEPSTLSMRFATEEGRQAFLATARAMYKYKDSVSGPVPQFPAKEMLLSYGKMPEEQKQWFFYWRSQCKSGAIEDTDAGYVILLLREVCYGFGWNSTDEALNLILKLKERFYDSHRIADIFKYWLLDYCVLYGTNYNINGTESLPRDRSKQAYLLMKLAEATPLRIPFQLISSLSAYPIETQVFFLSRPDYRRVVTDIVERFLTALDNRYRKQDGSGFFDRFNCPPIKQELVFFEFKSLKIPPYCTMTLDLPDYWACDALRNYIGALCQTVENKVRRHMKLSGTLKILHKLDEADEALLDRFLTKYFEVAETQEQQARVISVKNEGLATWFGDASGEQRNTKSGVLPTDDEDPTKK